MFPSSYYSEAEAGGLWVKVSLGYIARLSKRERERERSHYVVQLACNYWTQAMLLSQPPEYLELQVLFAMLSLSGFNMWVVPVSK
jgi:hypothetical protein